MVELPIILNGVASGMFTKRPRRVPKQVLVVMFLYRGKRYN